MFLKLVASNSFWLAAVALALGTSVVAPAFAEADAAALAKKLSNPVAALSSVPLQLNASVAKVTKFGSQLASMGGGLRYWVESPDSGPQGLALRLALTLLFPK